jgi:hypothetical protein
VIGLPGSEVLEPELLPVAAKVERSTRESAFLSAARSGTRSFGIAGLGGAAGALAVGNILSAVVGAAASRGVEAVGDDISILRQQRSDKALLQLALSFTENAE